MRQLKPVNRHLVIVPHVKKNETPSGVVLPDDYAPEEDLYVEATVLAMAEDCSEQLNFLKSSTAAANNRIIVDRSMIREINLKSETFHVILENYVVGTLAQRSENED